jgi:PIN domain nuclease of toxin-antitoxin system
MRLLVDTNAVLRAVDNPELLTAVATTALRDPGNDLLLSVGSLWEIGIKVALKKLTLSLPYRQWMERAIADLDLQLLPITLDHADVQAGLPFHHRDPFDRLLVAQAQAERIAIVSSDAQLDRYGIARVWG